MATPRRPKVRPRSRRGCNQYGRIHSMTTHDFIDLLAERKLVSKGIAGQLRLKADQGDDRITPKSILKFLVKKELVDRATAKQLLETTLVVSDKAESSILGLAPLQDADDPAPTKSKPAKPAPAKPPTTVKPEPISKPADKPQSASPLPPKDDFFSAFPGQPGTLDIDGSDADPFVADDDAVEQTAAEKPLRDNFTLSRGKRGKRKPKAKKTSDDGGPPQKLGKNKNEWDSPLLLIGGGAVAVLVVASLVLWWLLFRESADAVLKQADDLFDAGAYHQAGEKYKEFMHGFMGHQDYSKAKVNHRMSALWDAVETRKDYPGAAKLVPEVLSDIENEQAFIADAETTDGLSEAKRQLSSLLGKIARGLADQADKAKDHAVITERIEQLNSILVLTENAKYVPDKLRNDAELASVRQTLNLVQTRQRRDADLAAALEKMSEAIAANKPADALAVRASLLKIHEVLAKNEQLAAKVVEISAAEKASVKFVPGDQAAETAPAPSPIVAELALAERRGNAVAGAEGSVFVRIDGGLYAIHAADGALLWRRFVGMDGPRPVLLPSGQVVAVDSHSGELVCLSADAGKLLWRQPLEGKLAAPVVAGNRLLVASEAGKLFILNAADGKLAGFVQFSQPLRLPPAVNDRGDRIYVVGEHSSLYTLAADDFRCVGVHYLGHAPGGVAAPPAAVLDKVVVADNSGAETCTLRILGLDDQGAVAKDVASHRLKGLVVNPLQVAGRRFATVTTLGEAIVFQAAVGGEPKSVTVLAAREPQDSEQLARFALLEESNLWIGGRQLTKLAVAPTSNQMTVQSLDRNFQGDAFDYPLQAAGKAVVHVRRPAGRAGVIVAAMDAAANRAAWETELAVPLAGAPAVDSAGGNITAGSATGAVFVLDREAMTRRVQDQAARLPGPAAPKPFTAAVDLGQSRLVLGAVESPALLHFRPGDPRQALTAVTLPGPLACAPVAWRDGFVAASAVGQVLFYNADTAAQAAVPFQPELTPGNSFRWVRPAVVGEGADQQLVISDGVEKVYLLSVAAQPQPHLEAAATVDVGPAPLVSPLAVIGNRVIAGTENGKLASYALPELTPAEPVDLGGRIVWGPFPAEDGALAALDSDELIAIAADGAVRWRQPLQHGQLGGEPIVAGGAAIVLCPAGGVARISLADGAEGAYVQLGQPVVAGPTALGQRLVLGAADGTLLIVNRP